MCCLIVSSLAGMMKLAVVLPAIRLSCSSAQNTPDRWVPASHGVKGVTCWTRWCDK